MGVEQVRWVEQTAICNVCKQVLGRRRSGSGPHIERDHFKAAHPAYGGHSISYHDHVTSYDVIITIK